MEPNLEETTKTPDTAEAATGNTATEADSNQKVTIEEFKISGETLMAKIKELTRRGNIRRIVIKNKNGHTLIGVPMTIGVIGGSIGAVFFPVAAAVVVIGTMVAPLTVVIERQASSPSSEHDQTGEN